MGFRIRKSVKLMPGVRVNLGGKRGPSLTVGPRGSSINVGPRGTYVNAGIPGTGISYRERLDAPQRGARPARVADDGQHPSSGAGLIVFVLLIGIILGALLF